ncbi:MAG: hypothetical protein PHV24_01045 [Candidatus Kapabacteria bacterium]|nr:hypothetical protein [Candidatus Kapabacteria bacterium]
MKNRISQLFLAFCLSIILVGCSDDDDNTVVTPNPLDTTSTPITNNNYWSMKVGTYWIYDNYAVNTESAKFGSPTSQDSIIIATSGTIDSKSAYTATVYKNGNLSEGYSFAPEKNALYVTADFVTPVIQNIPFVKDYITIPEFGWLKIADTQTASWELFPSPIKVENMAIPYEITGVTNPVLNMGIQAIISRKSTGTMVNPVTGATVNTLTFEIKYEITGTVSGTVMSVMPIEAEISGAMYSYITFAEGIGLVANYRPTQTLSIIASIDNAALKVLLGGQESISIFEEEVEGEGSFLIRYNN